ncbi:non-specific lipid-transfer protein P5-like [Mangifera indica]|uniref:non-specific lipid-transfer protein P5-like n=1 Tax=Mangifera indica TaxID=29780 RepID=UPI001CFC0CCC|nr:non-specific lipid-transfer protein P5-like [Mangifera indica]
MASLKLVCALAFALLVVAPVALALNCGQVATDLSACINYLKTDGTGTPPAGCCTGVKNLNNQASTTKDRQDACRCLQNAAKSVPGLQAGTAASLPSKCGVNIPYKISTSTNCASIK